MTTKAQDFRRQQQRDAHPAKTKKVRRTRSLSVDTALPGVSASDRKVGNGSSGGRNVSARSAKKGGAVLEDSATGRASRKSTRRSTGGANRTSALRQQATQKAAAPKTQASKASVARA